ncbi:hypothetical protein BHE90_014498 [Fusarium euwallaceae]|uniref:Uncharacterized protein n=2 Tax=Fusarium solani species complex TaxID=232080 RepID=A0A430L5W7_9HYPO|nr:hypothetical protein CEP51_016433 [Fusarium floridanum]RTE71099.1 hypothetical protein BHE90_014498 [Fusarium euwallaceae]
MLPIYLYGLFALGSAGFATYALGWFGYQPVAPPKDFLARVCPMQWDIYDENNQHSTLYHFLGVSPTAKRDDILIAYQQAIQKSEIETRPCLDSIIDETGERITEGIPQACHTDEYALAGKRHGLITRAAGVLTDENQAQKLYDIHFLSAMYQIEDMGDKVADKSNLAKWKKNMGKMMRQQSEIRKSMCSLCGAYAREGHCPKESRWQRWNVV